MRNHRVPLLGESWRLPARRTPDIEASADPQVQLVLAGLRELVATAPAPQAQFRSELRAQLVAIAPRVVAEGDPAAVVETPRIKTVVRAATPATAATGGRASRGSARPTKSWNSTGSRAARGGALALPLGRIMAVATAMVVALVVLLGGAVYFSQGAVPGDTLYGVKLAAERAQLAMDSDSERPKDLLRFASYRVDEARQLARQSQASAAGSGPVAGGLSSHTQSLIGTALASFDSDVREASRLLGNQAVANTSSAPLTTLTTWAPTQVSKLKALSSQVSGSTVSSQVTDSINVVSTARARAKALVDCGCLGSKTDSYGPKPCVGCASTAPAKGKTTAPTSGTHRGGGTGAGTNGPARTAAPLPGTSTIPILPLPTTKPSLPTSITLPSAPKSPLIGTTSCGLRLNVLGIPINVGRCPSSSS